MASGLVLKQLKNYAEERNLTMAELGARGGRKSAAVRRKRVVPRYTDEQISQMWWNQD